MRNGERCSATSISVSATDQWFGHVVFALNQRALKRCTKERRYKPCTKKRDDNCQNGWAQKWQMVFDDWSVCTPIHDICKYM